MNTKKEIYFKNSVEYYKTHFGMNDDNATIRTQADWDILHGKAKK